jgi:ATP phosphoribosyltransferase-like protein
VLHSEATLYALSTYDTEEKNGEKVDPHSPLSRLMFRMRSVLRAKQSKYVVLNAPNEAIPLICQLLPGVTSPTIVPLAIPDWSAIHSVIAEEKFWEVIEELTGAGAQGILVMPIEKIVSDEPPLSKSHRRISYLRKTNETKISLTLNLDGKGESRIKSGLGFLDHMLTLFAKHSNIDLDLEAEGDLQVDEHHTVEDISIALGEGVAKALGDKRSISRYAFLLPMDEAQAEIALDLSGRAFLLWQADFKREYVGDVPTELWQHFFRSFADALKCNLHIKVVGDNDHHKIEAIFKGVARALKDGIKRDFLNTNIPSTKGVI